MYSLSTTIILVDKSTLYSIIVVIVYKSSSNISLNAEEKEFWYENESYSVIFGKSQLASYSKIPRGDITTKRVFEWIWSEVGIQPGEYLVKRHNNSYRYDPDIEIRFSREAFAYWKLQGFPVDRL